MLSGCLKNKATLEHNIMFREVYNNRDCTGDTLYHHIRQGEASNVLHELSKCMVWGASLTTGNLSAGVMVLTTISARGEMDYKQIHLPPFL
jgi:hypothetical protein